MLKIEGWKIHIFLSMKSKDQKIKIESARRPVVISAAEKPRNEKRVGGVITSHVLNHRFIHFWARLKFLRIPVLPTRRHRNLLRADRSGRVSRMLVRREWIAIRSTSIFTLSKVGRVPKNNFGSSGSNGRDDRKGNG